MTRFIESLSLMLVLLNPFALSVYLIDLFHQNTHRTVVGILTRAVLIAFPVFVIFAWGGEAVFESVLQIRFAAFQIFGGIVFLLFAVRYMVAGGEAVVSFRGEPGQIAGHIAMPFLIGPGTVSASVIAGSRLPMWLAVLVIFSALAITALTLIVLKLAMDHVRKRNVRLIERYVDITARISAVVLGSLALELIFQGVESWLRDHQLPPFA